MRCLPLTKPRSDPELATATFDEYEFGTLGFARTLGSIQTKWLPGSPSMPISRSGDAEATWYLLNRMTNNRQVLEVEAPEPKPRLAPQRATRVEERPNL